MQIFQLRESRNQTVGYKSPCIEKKPKVGMPGLKCDVCGNIWTNTIDKIPHDLPADHPLRTMSRAPVSPAIQRLLAQDVKEVLNLPPEQQIDPGTRVGHLQLLCVSDEVSAFVWPYIATVVIRDDVANFLAASKFSGWRTEAVNAEWVSGAQNHRVLYELLIIGRGGKPQIGETIERTSICDACGYMNYRYVLPRHFHLDPKEWDGSGIFRFNPPFNGWIFVTDEFADQLSRTDFDNYELNDMETFVKDYEKTTAYLRE